MRLKNKTPLRADPKKFYLDTNGLFDYKKYKHIQVAGNVRKICRCWVIKRNISFLSKYIKRHVPDVSFGLCHGTRRGKEQAWFREFLQCEVIGTEISHTASQFPHTIEWDFHKIKPEWVDSVDFIYSNSFDHSYDPFLCLNRWMQCVRRTGLCIIEHTSKHEVIKKLDPFGATLDEMLALIRKWGQSRFNTHDVLDAPCLPPAAKYAKFIIIKHSM